jgi:carbon storage regulator
MLVLSRKTGERIQISDNIWITVVRIGPNNVRLGIEAPRNVSIIRDELIEAGAEGGVGMAEGQIPIQIGVSS